MFKKRLCLALVSMMILVTFITPLCGASGEQSATSLGQPVGNIDWKQFEGTTITCFFIQTSMTEFLMQRNDDFEALTGIKVQYEVLPEAEYFPKLILYFNSNAPDVYMLNPTPKAQYLALDCMEPMAPYIDNPQLTDKAWFKPEDFVDSALLCGGDDAGNLYGFPINADYEILFYRKDIYEEKGLKVPETFDELMENAKALHSDEMNGIVLRMARNSGAWWPFGGMNGSAGEYWITKDHVSNMTDPAVKRALAMYAGLMKEAGPAASLSYTWFEASQDFAAGKAAHFFDSSGFIGVFENRDSSAVVGKVGYAMLPTFEKGGKRVASINHWLVGMGKEAQNKEAGYLYCQWATSPQMQRAFAEAEAQIVRYSLMEDEELNAQFPEQWLQAQKDTAPYCDPHAVPMVVEALETGDVLTICINEIYEGRNIDEAAQEAQDKLVAILGK